TTVLYQIDLVTGQTTQLLQSTPQVQYSAGPISPDNTRVIINMTTPWRQDVNLAAHSAVLEISTGTLTPVWNELDRWFSPQWLTNSQLVAACDDEGAGAIYVGAPTANHPTRVTPQIDTWTPNPQLSAARAYTSLATDPADNTATRATVYAIASGISASPHLLRFTLNPTALTVNEPEM